MNKWIVTDIHHFYLRILHVDPQRGNDHLRGVSPGEPGHVKDGDLAGAHKLGRLFIGPVWQGEAYVANDEERPNYVVKVVLEMTQNSCMN